MFRRSHVAAALLCALALSCRPPCLLGDCFTRCGVYACSSRCVELQAAEDRAVAVFTDAGFNTCQELKGYEIEVMRKPDGGPAIDWTDEYIEDGGKKTREVSGLTYCDTKLIRLGTDDWHESAYSHEVRHVVDRCLTSEHEGWLDGGVFEMIERAR